MTRVIIKASNAGFHNLSPLGAALAPNVFLKTAVNIKGLVISTDTGWQSAESAMYTDFGIEVVASSAASSSPKLGEQTEITITELVYYRIENGEKIIIGTMELPEPLTVTATYDQIGTSDFGWIADAGTALEDMLQSEGYVFLGGDGDDIFAPDLQILPIYGKTQIIGGAGEDHITGGLGDDYIRGEADADFIFDPAGHNRIFGGGGDDYIQLGDGSDHSYVWGGSGHDTLISGVGSDHLIGASGNDTIIGGGGDDILEGLRDKDIISGGAGDDTIVGGKGNDILTGGSGADSFVFYATDRGHDIITDFTDGEDTIVFHDVESFDGLTIVQSGLDTEIIWAGGSSILLEDTDTSSITADDFLFL